MTLRPSRSAFSLLEMVVALAIGVLLFGALYATLNTQIRQTHDGREIIEEGAIVRAVVTRISNDLMSQVAPYDPRLANSVNNASSNSTGGTTGSGTTGNSTTGGTGATTPSSSSGMAGSANASTTTATVTPAVVYNVEVYGTSTMLQVSNYRVQTAPPGVVTGTIDPNAEVVSDLRRVTYWLNQNGSETLGLCRREFRQATNDNINDDPTTFPDQLKAVIAPEVLNVTFEYYDGTEWQQQWDGTQLGADEVTPIGPPVAIRITLILRRSAGSDDQGSTYQHVVALSAANFFNQTTQQSTTTQP